jgi:SAM-dependent methyltransferase
VYSEYDRFAPIYNKYWGDMFTHEAIAAFDKFLFNRLPAKATILDLCCGTGQLAKVLSSRGYAVTGVDGSREMLRFARKNAPKCKFILADARNFDQSQSFEAAVSAFDSLNHITKLDELKVAFLHTYDALKRGGIFLFDLNTDEHFRRYWHGSFGVVEDDHSFITRSNYDTKHKVARMDITIFFLRGFSWTRSDLSLVERHYAASAVVSALRQAGFVKLRCYDSHKDLRLQDVGRMFFVGERPK